MTVLVSLVLLSGCSVRPDFGPLPDVVGSPPTATVVLIGDAGAAPDDASVLRALRAVTRDAAARGPAVVAFLGDNVYPAGVRGSDPAYTADTLMLGRQVDAVAGTGARAVFVPGNHDWDDGGADALGALERQRAFLHGRAGPGDSVSLLPTDGCPGPEIVDLPGVRLVIVDTQWFLHEHARGCPNEPTQAVVESITAAIDGAAGRDVVVLTHHPMRTHGTHGGFFSWRSHLFPLVDAAKWAWVPLPVVGSAYVAARKSGASDQDLSHEENREMRALLEQAFRDAARPPLLHAAGHEHSLEVLRGALGGPAFYLVSGAGSKSTAVGRGDDTVLAAQVPGFMVLEARPGRVRISVVVVPEDDSDGDAALGGRGWCRELDVERRELETC